MGETSRQFRERCDALSFDRRCVERGRRNDTVEPLLRKMLAPGARLRATKATCGAKEATFVFSHWEGWWIVSKSGHSIAPASVYSVDGEVILA